MSSVSRFLTSRWGPILTGAIVGVLAPLLVRMGNPAIWASAWSASTMISQGHWAYIC